jgi:hypothetical protein
MNKGENMSKKILITGMNKLQCTKDFYLKQQLQVVPSHYSLIRCLEGMGYEVEQRPVKLGEDLSGYDEVVVYIHSIQAFCQFIWSGLYAVKARPDCIIAFDDWQFSQIFSTIETYQEKLKDNDEGCFRQYLFDLWQGQEDKETVMSYKDDYIEACDIITSRNNRLLVSAFAGGDLSLLNLGWKEENVYSYNPNPYHLNRNAENGYGTGTVDLGGFFEPEKEKDFKWNFASLVQEKTRKWLKLQQPEDWKWEIAYFGAKRGKYKSERKTEPEMVKVFEQQWGCLMPGYFHAGCGWWRARPLQVADAGSILIGDKPEMMVYYQDEELAGLRVQDVEAMTYLELKAIAKRQRDALYANHPLDKDIQHAEIQRALSA